MKRATNGSAGAATSSDGGPDLEKLPLDEHADPVRERRGVLEVVRDEDRRQSEAREEVAQLAADRVARVRVERGQRLVEQEHRGLARERPRERDALALAARERRPGARRRGPRSAAARATSSTSRLAAPKATFARTSGAGTARTPGTRARPTGAPAGTSMPVAVSSHARRRARSDPRSGRRSPATARRTLDLPAPGRAHEGDRLRPTSSV